MPPPPMSPQGSRGGLITAAVILSILFVTSAIFAFYYNAENNKSLNTAENANKKLNQYANAEAQADSRVQGMVEKATETRQSAIQVALDQIDALNKLIAGSA